MQRKRLLKLVAIGLFILILASAFFVYASVGIYETFLCNRSVSLEGEENVIVEFYMPQGAAIGVKFDFSVSSGIIKYWIEPSSHFDCNRSYFKQFIDEMTNENPSFLIEVGNETHERGFNVVAENPEKIIEEEYLDQIWYIYLSNEDMYDKEVQIEISKQWQLW